MVENQNQTESDMFKQTPAQQLQQPTVYATYLRIFVSKEPQPRIARRKAEPHITWYTRMEKKIEICAFDGINAYPINIDDGI